jgi:hypothetical protein
MSRFKKTEVSFRDYEIIRQNQEKSGKVVHEQVFGQRKSLYNENNQLLATYVAVNSIDLGALNKSKFVAFLASFSRQLYSQFDKNPDLYALKVVFTGVSSQKNRKLYDSIRESEIFYHIDLNSAYWQFAHKLGYLSDDMFEKYQPLEEYKAVKRLCISFLARSNKMTYKLPSGEDYVVKCEMGVLNQVYRNIRYSIYNAITKCFNEKTTIAFNIDSISVLKSQKDSVCKYLDKQGLTYKITICQKLTNKSYMYGSEERKF